MSVIVTRGDGRSTIVKREETGVRVIVRAAQVIRTGGGGEGGGGVSSVNGDDGPDVVLTQDDIADGTTAKQFTATEKTKLAGIATGATANAADSALRDRASHTGEQAIATITNLQTALDAKQAALGFTPENAANKNAADGYAGLDGGGKVPASLLPSYVDDVLEFANLAAFPATGETGKLYVALDSNKVYRWSGSAYVEMVGSPGSTDAVTEGSTNLYFTAARVRAALLDGLSVATNAAITAADSVLGAFGKLQAQITGLIAELANKQPLSALLTNTTASFTTAQESKLAGIATGATANAADAALRDRTTHTGEQAISTITNLQTSLDAKAGTATVTTVSASRDLTSSDDGKTLEMTNPALTLTIPTGLPANFACIVIPNGTTSIASSGGTLLNGATTTLTRSATSQLAFGILARGSASNSYVVMGY